LASGSAGRHTTFAARVPRNAWHSAVSSGLPARHRPIAPSPSHTSTRGTAPRPLISCHQPLNKSAALRVGMSTPISQREYPHTIVSTGSCTGRRTCPHPTGTMTGGNQKSHWAISPAAYAVRLAGSGGKYTGRSSRTRSFSTVRPRSQPIRSAITVAGIVGYDASSSRIRGSTASTIDPARFRSYFGGPSLAIAARTVFLEIPSTRAIALTGICSARCSRRISAQSSTDNNPFLPWLG
jgi:hypothetical protein